MGGGRVSGATSRTEPYFHLARPLPGQVLVLMCVCPYVCPLKVLMFSVISISVFELLDSWLRHWLISLARTHIIDMDSWYWQHPWYWIRLMVYYWHFWITLVREGRVLPMCGIFNMRDTGNFIVNTYNITASVIFSAYNALIGVTLLP